MRSKFLEAYNAINLIRNGGLDFVGSGMPPFWQLDGASFGGQSPNVCSVVRGETPSSEHAAVNYFKVFVTSSAAVVLRYVVAERFIQPAFSKDVAAVSDGGAEYPLDSSRVPPGYMQMRACQLLYGELSASWSLRVVSGLVKISVRTTVLGVAAQQGLTRVVYPAFTSKSWVRPVVRMPSDDSGLEFSQPIKAFEFYIEKVGGEVAEAHLGAFMAASGAYDILPYTGDPMADAIPRGAIVFAVGDTCPPGFEKLVLAGVPSKGRAFLKSDAPADLAVVGEETHRHENMVEKMDPENDWPGLAVEEGWGVAMDESGRAEKYPADLGWDIHTHPIDAASVLPSSRDVVLCKRL